MKRILFTISLIILPASLAFANYGDTYGISAKAVGMGNAVTSIVDDWSSTWYNMSGLGKVPPKAELKETKTKVSLLYKTLTGEKKQKTISEKSEDGGEAHKINNNELAVTYLYTIPNLEVTTDVAQETKNEKLQFGAFVLGLVIDMNTFIRMPFDLNARLGVLFAIQDDLGLGKVTDDDPRTHYFMRYGRRIQRFITNLGVGIEVWKNHMYIGGGISVFAGGKGSVQIQKVQITQEDQNPPTRTKLDLQPSSAPLAGLSFKWDKLGPGDFNFGFCYRDEIYLKIDPFDTQATTDLAGVDMKMSIAIFDFYTPKSFTGGLSYAIQDLWIFKELVFSVDAELQQWSRYNDLAKNYLKRWEDTFEVSYPQFKDIIIYKAGFEQTVLPWLKIREGYMMQPAFTPEQNGNSNYLDNDKHIISLGAGFIIPDVIVLKVPVEVDIAYQYQMLQERSATKDTTNPYNPSYKYGGSVHTFFGSIRWRY
ncbi:MAG TPA: outer membrane protein transport protein [Spirochaetota bacterium]|nr:outer membrane protein transport protein [Spirochaetota bacterium]HNT10379.1 outer membrane protein transport protein [Spirochaetota bacterium]HNV47533.1 outer membrane protein transport protein [Spirochaetota bacterium]HOS41438.1 outer membrane protein transport protein [Spirochaetota bacterium]